LNYATCLEYDYDSCRIHEKTKVKLFQDLSIRKKLIGIILLISAIILIVTFSLIVFAKTREDRVRFTEEVKQHAAQAGEYCRQAVVSKKRRDLEACLSVLSSVPYITDSVFFGPDSNALASYSLSEETFIPSAAEPMKSSWFTDRYLHVLLPVSDGENTYGKIFVRASTEELNRKLRIYIFIMAVLLGLALLLVYFLARGFQHIISKPIVNLVTATKNISGPGEAGARIKKKKSELMILRDRLKYLLESEKLRELKLEEVNKTRQKAEELEKTGKKYLEIFENNAYGIFIFEAVDKGKDFIIKDLNTTGEKMERTHRSDLIGKKITKIFPVVRESGLLEALQNVWKTEVEEYLPYTKLRVSDKAGWKEFFISKLPSGDMAAAFRDVTDRKTEEQVSKKQEGKKERIEEGLEKDEELKSNKLDESVRQQALNNELEGLFSATAQYLESPLEKINEFSKSFLEDYANKVNDKGKDKLIQIRAAAHRMKQMTKGLTEVAELSFDRLKFETVDLSDIVRKRSVKLREGNPERKAEFAIQKGIKVRGDNRMLSIVIDNLLTNAWIYSSKKPNIKIEFGIKENKGFKEYFIKDNGIGFEMTDVDDLFCPFKRLNENEVFPGSGMGLAVTRRIVHKHGGVIRAEGKPGEGAVFYFTLGT